MSKRFNITIKDDRFIKALKSVGDETKKGKLILAAGRKATLPLVKEMRANAKALGLRESGDPKNPKFKTLTYKLIKNRAKNKGADSYLVTGPQGRENAKSYWVEYGTPFIKPRPYITPAVDKLGGKVQDKLADQMWKVIERKWNKV